MGIFTRLKKKEEVLDFSLFSKDNVQSYADNGELVLIYLISRNFGGSEEMENIFFVTEKAAIEKSLIDKKYEKIINVW